jgi:DNA-binding PucR family transcriptional regulator
MIRGFFHVLHVLNRPCRKNNQDISRELDDALPRSTRIGLKLHYILCGPCRRFRRQLYFLRAAADRLHEAASVRALTSIQMPVEVRERLRRRLSDL